MTYSGKWKIDKINRLLLPYEMFNGTDFVDLNSILQEYTTPLVYREVDVSPKLAAIPLEAIFPNLNLSAQLEYIGNKTYSASTLLYDRDTKEVYGRTRNRLVFMKRGTSSAVAIPEWWRKKFSDKISGEDLPFQPPVPLPKHNESTHIFKTQASWNDINYNCYLDHQTYLPICLDGMMDALVKNKLKGFRNDILYYPVKNINFTYNKLGRGGDLLKLHIKQNVDNPYLLNMALFNDDGVLGQTNLEFGDPLP